MNNANEMGLINVWWMVREEIVVGTTQMHEILIRNGIDPEMMRIPSDRECVRRGIDSFHSRRGYKRRVVEKISETPNKAIFGILGINVDKEHENSSYIQNTKVILDKNNGCITAEGDLSDEVLDRVDSFRGTYNSEDLRILCKNVVRSCHGISKRPTGGVYMIPDTFRARIDSLNAVLKEAAGHSACVYVERIFNGEDERNVAAASVFEDLSKRIGVIMKSVKGVTKQVCRLKGKSIQMDEINYMANIYQQILGDQETLKEFTVLFNSAAAEIEKTIEKLTVSGEAVGA